MQLLQNKKCLQFVKALIILVLNIYNVSLPFTSIKTTLGTFKVKNKSILIILDIKCLDESFSRFKAIVSQFVAKTVRGKNG